MDWARHRLPALLSAVILLALVACSATQSPSAVPSVASPSVVPVPTGTPSPTPEPTPEPLNADLLNHRFTVLVIGEDVSAERRQRGYRGDNTDAIMVISISANQRKVAMLSLPRDTVDVPLGNGSTWTSKVNGIASQYGLDGLRQAIAALMGIDIPYYVKVDMDDFIALVDAVGGVNVAVKTYVQEPRWGLYLSPGRAHLDGLRALYYSRTRKYDSDYARAARQQQLVRALVAKYTDPKTHVRIAKLLPALAGLETNLDLGDLRTIIALGRRAIEADYVATVLSPPQFALDWGDTGDGRGWIIIPNVDAIRAYTRSVFGN
jgi:polyisoprenyl-teichoic acid--peptidoglycan teichoic acid transferase